jgi:hypothetical protein
MERYPHQKEGEPTQNRPDPVVFVRPSLGEASPRTLSRFKPTPPVKSTLEKKTQLLAQTVLGICFFPFALLFRLIMPVWSLLIAGSYLIGALMAATLHLEASAPKESSVLETAHSIPLRYQWNENNGYCGESSLIAAGLYYGQYFSQYDARAIAAKDPSSPVPNAQTDCQLLLGQNDGYTASQMHLDATSWSTEGASSTKDFLSWVKKMVAKGYPVAIGVYTNEYLFYGDTNPNAGQQDYDHIVTVTRIDAKDPEGPYSDDDRIFFDDHALWNPDNKNPPYIFSYTFKEFQKSREEANAKNGPIYSLCNDSSIGNFAIAIKGVKEEGEERYLKPVFITPSTNREWPEIFDGSNERPMATPLSLSIQVSDLKPGERYHIYKYNDETAVPNSRFNANADKACQTWSFLAEGTSHTFTDPILSSDQAIYRVVSADAP